MTSSGVGFASPILAGAEESWRRFLQELAGSRRAEYTDLRRRMGITAQRVWLLRIRSGEMVILYLECEEPRTIAARLAASTEPFDLWLKARLVDFHGCDFARVHPGWSPELVFDDENAERRPSTGERPNGAGA
jgi:hypothetical protein